MHQPCDIINYLHTKEQQTVLYASSVWGLGQGEELEKIHSKFIKQLLNISQHTPNYMTRLETGKTKLECRILTGALKYFAKLQGMDEDRFPRTCLEKLKKLDRSPSNNRKYNWYTKVRKELEAINGEEILQLSRQEILNVFGHILFTGHTIFHLSYSADT